MSNVITNEDASTTGAQSTLQGSMTSAVTDALNSLSVTETNSTTANAIPKYTTWIRVLEDIGDWNLTDAEELGIPRLKLHTGDILKVEERRPQNDFWIGSNGKDTGSFPIDPRLEPVVYSKVISLHDKTIDLGEDEIPFRAGQVMDVVAVLSNWRVRVSFDSISSNGKQRFQGIVPLILMDPIPPEGMTDNPKPESDPDAIDQFRRWKRVPEFSVRVLSDYKAQSEKEIDLVVNDIVVVTKVWAEVYYYGSKNGHFGGFSASHVSKDLSMSTRPPYHRYYVRVMWDYLSGTHNQMNLVSNEIIEVMWINPSGWWEGRSRDGKRRGLFPANYVRRVVDARAAL
ncbi:hypothetical protein FS842_000535 [Serendipita sp. 407]|nr:hypothetical protein FS842_000535 [Serendipita sp. 407]